ncbi:hypothetical protein KSS87_011354 [Heliosperma pusillum]|nr:hypothetical protein KSS87_011354 [Heliosperma pusillum]
MAANETLSFSVASVVEDVLQQHGNRPTRGLDLDSRRAEEAGVRRYEAFNWLRKMVGVVVAKDLPAEPSEEEFRLGLRSGMILCNVLNKVQPGAVPKVVESPTDSACIPDGAALSAYQYFENVRNFLVAVEEIGLPSFEASDLAQGGISARVVNSVLALKSYHEWKQSGGSGLWKFGGNVKPTTSAVKQFVRKNSEPFTNSISRNSSMSEKSLSAFCQDVDNNRTLSSRSLSSLIQALLSDKKPEEVPQLVESVLSRVVDEFEQRMGTQNDLMNQPRQGTSKELSAYHGNKSFTKMSYDNFKAEDINYPLTKKETLRSKYTSDEKLKGQLVKQREIFNRQGHDIQELKHTLQTTKAGMQFMQSKFHEDLRNLGSHMHGLAQAASGYHKVLEENRRLYNEVQDLKGNIRVYCRVRPFLGGQPSYTSAIEHFEEGNITIRAPSKHGNGHKSFSFNKVFGPSATQAEVFSDMQPLIRSVLDGYNVCIFAYGQTGSGKTFTMSGPRDLTEESQGVNYRSLGDLFYLAEQRKHTFRYDVAVQMIEIYNEQVRDLLVSDGLNKRYPLSISNKASLVPVSSTSDVIHLMNVGHRNRAVGATALNDRSSRSHSCLTVHVQGKDLTTGGILRGCMHLVDLAGSERVDKSEVTGDRLKEAQHINKSLSALGDVIASLAQRNAHVPYRNSKLTQLLQDSLGGQAKTLMFVHMSPEPEAVGETISTLKFAERVATVELGAAQVNKDGADVKELKEQIANLKAALARKEGQSIRPRIEARSPERCRGKADGPSPIRPNQNTGDVLVNGNRNRQPMGDVATVEVISKSTPRQKRQSFDLDELLKNSPPWPPAITPGQNCGDEEKDPDSGEWVDKIMVNKKDSTPKAENQLSCWEAENGDMTDSSFYQKYFPDGPKLYSDQSYNIFSGRNQFEVTTGDDLNELDAATSDSSEPDLLWQFNHSKLPTLSNGNVTKTKKFDGKPSKSPELSKSISMLGPSPSRKLQNGRIQKNGRQQHVSAEGKRRPGNRN